MNDDIVYIRGKLAAIQAEIQEIKEGKVSNGLTNLDWKKDVEWRLKAVEDYIKEVKKDRKQRVWQFVFIMVAIIASGLWDKLF